MNSVWANCLFGNVRSEGGKLVVEFLRDSVAEGLEELFDAVGLFSPESLVDAEHGSDVFDGDIEAVNVDVFRFRLEADLGLDCVDFAFAAGDDPEKDSQVEPKPGHMK